ncbi:hypothetical protein M0805_003532 [Coniferiporia weirii]|nr:hypothetical protein M0805_003532 [Coniferiporia weirii]
MKYGTVGLYGQSKYGNVVVAHELARRYGDQGIISVSLNPGGVKTDIKRRASTFQDFILSIIMFSTLALGAPTQLWAGTMSETAAYNGKYLVPWTRIGKPRKDTQDPEIGIQLWDWLEEQVKNI